MGQTVWPESSFLSPLDEVQGAYTYQAGYHFISLSSLCFLFLLFGVIKYNELVNFAHHVCIVSESRVSAHSSPPNTIYLMKLGHTVTKILYFTCIHVVIIFIGHEENLI